MILSLGLGRSIKWGKSCSCSMEQRACWSIHHSQVEQHWPWCIGCCRRSWSVDSKHAFYFLVLFLPYHNIIISEMQKWTLFFFMLFLLRVILLLFAGCSYIIGARTADGDNGYSCLQDVCVDPKVAVLHAPIKKSTSQYQRIPAGHSWKAAILLLHSWKNWFLSRIH
jgi:hypothetical protein